MGFAACSKTPSGPPNILLVSIDTLRADHLSSYGNPLPVSPLLDHISVHGTLFMDVSAQAPWTMPSHYSVFTGQYVSHHGMMLYHNKPRTDMVTMAAVLKEHGYDTAAFTGGAAMSSQFGYAKGFNVYESPGLNFDKSVPAAISYLKKRQKQTAQSQAPFFIFLHGFDVHSPYRCQEPFPKFFTGDYASNPIDSRAIPIHSMSNNSSDLGPYLAQYDSCIRSADSYLTQLFRKLKEFDQLENTLVILFSDHGEEFMDHGGFDHNWMSLYRCDIGTILILSGPGIPEGEIVGYPVQNVDIFPWLMDYLKIPVKTPIDGINLFATERINGTGPVVSENLLFHYLLVDSDNDYFIQNSVHFWVGTVRPADTKMSLEEAVFKEFGTDNRFVQKPNDKEFIINTGFMNAQIKLCNPGDNEGCFVMFEIFDIISPGMTERIFERQRCLSDENPETIIGWSDQTMGNCIFSMPNDSYKLSRSVNEQCLRMGRWKLIHDFGDDSIELYDLETDPGERHDVSDRHPDVALDFRIKLKDEFHHVEHRDDIFSLDEVDKTTRDSLHALGYIQGD